MCKCLKLSVFLEFSRHTSKIASYPSWFFDTPEVAISKKHVLCGEKSNKHSISNNYVLRNLFENRAYCLYYA